METSHFDPSKLKTDGIAMLDLIQKLATQMEQGPVKPHVEPGFLRSQFPLEPPAKGKSMQEIYEITEKKIFPGILHWQHPQFFAYFPSSVCNPSILADMFASTFHSPAFVWNASPSHTEVENIVVDWMAQLLGLPEVFLLKNNGGGSIATCITDAALNTVHAAKRRKMKEKGLELDNPDILKLVGYYTEHSHICGQKSLQMKDICHIRVIPVNYDEKEKNYLPDLKKFEQMVQEDIKNGLIPFWVHATLGTTGTCAYDPIDEIGKICQKYKIWLNVDAAYSGIAWLLPEFRRKGLELVDSVLINGAKFFMVGNVGTLIYIKDKKQFQQAFAGQDDLEIYKNKYSEYEDVTDYKNWGIGFGRRMNCLKFFFVINHYGQEGLQFHIKSKVELAKYFEKLIKECKYYEEFTKQDICLVTFVLKKQKQIDQKQQNTLHQEIKKKLDENTQFGYITPNQIKDIYYMRFIICNSSSTKEHVDKFFNYLIKCTQQVLEQYKLLNLFN